MYYFIVNPVSRSGRGKKYWEQIKPILEQKKIAYRVVLSKREGHTTELVKQLCKANPHKPLHVVILGGDGTVNEAIQGIQDFSRFILSYIPTGSSNDLARDLGISKDPREALEAILKREHDCYMDMGLLRYEKAYVGEEEIYLPDRRFMVGCGIGFDAAVCEETFRSQIKRVLNKIGLGKLTYVGIALKQLLQADFITGSLTLDEQEPISFRGLIFMVGMVHRYEGGGFMFCPLARADDGMLDFCLAAGISKLRIISILPTAYKGKHLGFKGVEQYRAHEALLKTDIPLWVHTDGEVKAKASAVRLSNMKEQIHLIY